MNAGGAQRSEDTRRVLPPPLVAFLDRFNRGDYWESHEVLEEAWRRNRSGFYHGLILLASAFVHVRRGNAHGIAAQLGKTARALAPYRPAYLGFDVDALVELATGYRAAVTAARASPPSRWSDSAPFITLEPDATKIRGNEPELCDVISPAPPC